MKLPIIFIVAAYFIGSIPFGVLIASARGKNLRKIGSGNIGATNLARALGKKWGYLCFVLDVSKGLIPVLIAGRLLTKQPEAIDLLWWLAVGCAAIIGHIFSVYLKFTGGKGVATSFGVALGLWPYFTICAGIAIIVWLFVLFAWRYVSLASITASVSFPVAFILLIILESSWRFTELWPLLIAAVGIPVMVIIRHRENIKRIMAGTENKIFQK
jgi:glycerol-3-phosphate acyltransferase PlsY